MREIKHKYTLDIEVAPDREVLMSNEDGHQVNKDAKAFVYSVATFNRDFDPITEQDKGYEQWHSLKGFDGMKAKDTDSGEVISFLGPQPWIRWQLYNLLGSNERANTGTS